MDIESISSARFSVSKHSSPRLCGDDTSTEVKFSAPLPLSRERSERGRGGRGHSRQPKDLGLGCRSVKSKITN